MPIFEDATEAPEPARVERATAGWPADLRDAAVRLAQRRFDRAASDQPVAAGEPGG